MTLALKRELLRKACEMQDQNGAFQHFALGSGIAADPVALSEVFGEMVLAGLFVVAVKDPPMRHRIRQSDFYYVTTRGRAFLEHAEKVGVPEDTEGFLAFIKRDPELDPYVEAAVAEALWAYGYGRPIAAIMCLFAAMERMVKAVGEAAGIKVDRKSINDVFVALGKSMEKQAKTAPSVQTFLSTTFPAVRKARNDAAHHADAPDLDKVRVLLCQFVSWYEAAVVLRDQSAT